MSVKPCECAAAGYCQRHKMTKGPGQFLLCQTREDYRAIWDQQAQPQFCKDWEQLGDTLFRCKRCQQTCSANAARLLPADRLCTPPQQIVDSPVKAKCGTCQPPPPSLASKVKGVVKAAADFVASGFAVSEKTEADARREICEGCDFIRGSNCGICGCVLAVKQKEKAAHCPAGFWPENEFPWLPESNDNWLKQVLVVIPAYGQVSMTQQAVRDCLREPVNVLVIDNKGDYQKVGREIVLAQKTNLGWAGSCELGIKRFLNDKTLQCIVLLNNDVRLSKRFFCGLLIAQATAKSGIVSACYSRGWREQVDSAGFSGAADQFTHKPVHRQVGRVDGTCVMLTRECLEELGPLDRGVSPEYGWGLLTDLCLRAHKAGIGVAVTEASYCEHLDGGMKTAKSFYGNVLQYQHAAMKESLAGLSRKWGANWESLAAPRPPTTNPPRPSVRKIATLNLIYHIWPVSTNDRWRWNVKQLLKRIHVFNGKKVVAIATGPSTSPVEEVKQAFAGHDVQFIEKPNSAQLREANTFLELLDAVKTNDPSQATFYGHAKGVTRPTMLAEAMWADAMYHVCLDDLDRVKASLATKGMYGLSFEFEQPFTFPGTFWWFHNASLFSKPNWRTLENTLTNEGVGWSVEAFPDRFFAHDCERVALPMVYPRGRSRHLIYSSEFWLAQTPSLEHALSRFDERHYLDSYYDIRRDVEKGILESGRSHYVRHGYEEGREGYSILKHFGMT